MGVGASLPSPVEGNRFNFRNLVFSSYLEFRTLDKVHETSDSEFKRDFMEVECQLVSNPFSDFR
jgi:hypothetical protein